MWVFKISSVKVLLTNTTQKPNVYGIELLKWMFLVVCILLIYWFNNSEGQTINSVTFWKKKFRVIFIVDFIHWQIWYVRVYWKFIVVCLWYCGRNRKFINFSMTYFYCFQECCYFMHQILNFFFPSPFCLKYLMMHIQSVFSWKTLFLKRNEQLNKNYIIIK